MQALHRDLIVAAEISHQPSLHRTEPHDTHTNNQAVPRPAKLTETTQQAGRLRTIKQQQKNNETQVARAIMIRRQIDVLLSSGA